jgi:ligand-binding SRPBCC domain-containing protein
MAHLQVSAIVPGARQEVFQFLCSPDRLPHLLKDHIEVEMVRGADALRRGAEFEFTMTRFGFTQPVRLRVEDVLKGSRITYRQAEGLFADWIHTSKFEDHGENQTLVTDFVDYSVPFGLFGHLADDVFLRRDLKGVLESRLKRAQEHFAALRTGST